MAEAGKQMTNTFLRANKDEADTENIDLAELAHIRGWAGKISNNSARLAECTRELALKHVTWLLGYIDKLKDEKAQYKQEESDLKKHVRNLSMRVDGIVQMMRNHQEGKDSSREHGKHGEHIDVKK